MNAEEIKQEIGKQIAEAVAQMGGNGQLDVVIREGEALPLHEPVKVEIVGVLNSPARWLEKRQELQLITNKCHVTVDREGQRIVLRINENAHYGTRIEGRLTLTDTFKKFHINDGHSFTLKELATLFKMNRSFFETKQAAMELVALLQNFKGKVNKDLEASTDNRGNKKVDFVQAVESNLPEAFTLHLPIFKGFKTEDVECEVYVDPDDWSCQLISPTANELIEKYRDKAFDEVLDGIEQNMPGVAIIEI